MFFLLTGCGFTTFHTDINPEIASTTVTNGKNEPITVKVTDNRESDSIGNRGFGNTGGTIVSNQNLATVVSQSLTIIAANNHFEILNNANSSINASILALHFYALDGQFAHQLTQTLTTETALQITATHNGKTFEKIYHGKSEKAGFVAYLSQDLIQQSINNSLSNVFAEIANDRSLWNFLAK